MTSIDALTVVKLWTQYMKPDLPNLRFELQQIGGMSKKDVDIILSKVTPEDLKEIYGTAGELE